MITMKKKALVAMAMAAAMVAMPVVAGAVTSPGSQSDGTIGHGFIKPQARIILILAASSPMQDQE